MQEGIDGAHPLFDPAGQAIPFPPGDDARHDVERDQPFLGLLLALDIEGDAGATDEDLAHFSIEKDRRYILPVLKKAKAKNPDLRFFASPWSPPGWMTSTGDMIGGHLLPKYYDAYARYFVRFIQAYDAEGISIDAVTIQNEPGVDRSNDAPKWH